MKNIKAYFSLILFLSLFFSSQTSNAVTVRYAAAGGSYSMYIPDSTAIVSSTPTQGSDYNYYYLITPSGKEGFTVDLSTVVPYGSVDCKVNYLIGPASVYLPPWNAYHRVFAYKPSAGFSINGLPAYRINANTVFTLYSDNGITKDWKNFYNNNGATSCSDNAKGPLDSSNFSVQFPLQVRIYVKNIPADGNLNLPYTILAGYTRLFQDGGIAPTIEVPESMASLSLYLQQSSISYPSNCRANTKELNFNHGSLDANSSFDSILTQTITFSCEYGQSVKVRLALDYTTDWDYEKRLPLKSYSDNTIYSKLTLYDEDTKQTGKIIDTTINRVKNIKVTSQIASSYGGWSGSYSGSAWLIATYL